MIESVKTKPYMRLLLITYFLFLVLVAIIPISLASCGLLNNTDIITILLEYLLHSLLFIPWVFLYRVTFRPATWSDNLIMVSYGLLMAFATEGVQYFITYRTYNINDLLSNFLGVLLGSFALLINWKQLRIKN